MKKPECFGWKGIEEKRGNKEGAMGAYRNDETLLMEAEKVTGERWEEPPVTTIREMYPNPETANTETGKIPGRSLLNHSAIGAQGQCA